jgi:hypothetical protein
MDESQLCEKSDPLDACLVMPKIVSQRYCESEPTNFRQPIHDRDSCLCSGW